LYDLYDSSKQAEETFNVGEETYTKGRMGLLEIRMEVELVIKK
jgi:hypothetical protein